MSFTDMQSKSPSSHDEESTSPPWLVARLVAELERRTNLTQELRLAVDHRGVRDGHRLSIALLGVMAFASRAGCRPEQVRRFIASFVRAGIGREVDRETGDRVVRRSVGFVDAVYLAFGADGFVTAPAVVLAEIGPLPSAMSTPVPDALR
jgi:hypothetical protein